MFLDNVATKFDGAIQLNGYGIVIDLNGHTWYENRTAIVWQSYATSSSGTGGSLTVKNGSLVSAGEFLRSEPFAENTNINFEKLSSASFAKPMIHTRGTVNVTDCPNITAAGDFILQMSMSNNDTTVNITNSGITAGGALSKMESLARSGNFYGAAGGT